MRITRWQRGLQLLGINPAAVSGTEKLISALGGFIGIAAVTVISQWLLPNNAAPWLIASMGASAVLLFAVPHGPLSQPWAFVLGHLLSAVIGVSCAQWLGTTWWSGAIAVGSAIGVMHLLRCIHPPGGATALTAVIGGDAVQQLGYQFVLAPVAVNVLALLIIAVLFNGLFHWRRYPAALIARPPLSIPPAAASSLAHPPPIDHAHLVAALSEIDSYIDISEQDLLRIYELATQQMTVPIAAPPLIQIGHDYSNDRFGQDWEVRRVIAFETSADDVLQVHFRTIAGQRRRREARMEFTAFNRWAAHEVSRDENSWRPVAG